MNKVLEYVGHTKPIIRFIVSSEFIFSLAQEGEFIIFNTRTGAVIRKKQFKVEFTIMMHPTTYVNKLLFAGKGQMQLWNIIDDSMIYEFKTILEGKRESIITAIT